MAEPASKKQCLLTKFISSEGSSKESEESFMETSEDQSSIGSTVSRKRSFLYSWTKIYSWVSVEGTGEDLRMINDMGQIGPLLIYLLKTLIHTPVYCLITLNNV